jgi:hypothetical protein
MPPKSVSLAQLHVDFPCTRDWDAMPGEGPTRFCDACGKHVHDLSRMTTAEAERLVSTATERLCVQYRIADDGHVQTLDYAPTRRPRFRARLWLPFAFVSAVAAAVAHLLLVPKVAPTPVSQMITGGIRPMPRPPSSVVLGKVAAQPVASDRP